MKVPGIMLFLLRHGQTDYNAARRFQGQSDTPLNDVGRSQARRTGEIAANLLGELLESGSNVVDAVSSDLPRAMETSQIVAGILKERLHQEVTFSFEKGMRELNVGMLQDHTVDEFEKNHPGFMREFTRQYEVDPYHTNYPGSHGESRAMLAARVARWINGLNSCADEAPVATIANEKFRMRRAAQIHIWSTHGAVIDVMLELLQVDLGGSFRMIGNGDLLVLEPVMGSARSSVTRGMASRAFAERFGCGREWALLRHYRVGDTVAARINVSQSEESNDRS